MNNPVSAILMSVKNEETLIDFSISYHLDLGVDYIFIANHCSTDNTNKILDTYKEDKRVIVINEIDPVFDQAKIVNNLLRIAKSQFKIDWFLFLDADEFLSIRELNIGSFIKRLEDRKIVYATIGWANALFDYTHKDYTCSPVNTIDTMKFYFPWPERSWQEYGHFRKTIVKNHPNMEVVVGGHYIRSENNPEFLGEFYLNPFIVPLNEARLLHFEFRTSGIDLYKKWEKLAKFKTDPSAADDSPWLERINTIKGYVEKYKNKEDEINKKWFLNHSTFWGTEIPEERKIHDHALVKWYGKYFRKKIESGTIKSVCLVRSGNLGDVIMSEPVASFLSKYVEKVYLATDVSSLGKYIKSYHKVIRIEETFLDNKEFDLAIRLIYEFSDNKQTYINGYLESVGFGDRKIYDLPKLDSTVERIKKDDYILLAPFTSSWEKEKRSWGYNKFKTLAKKIEDDLGYKCLLLEENYSFDEMVSLIRHSKFFVGNDSGPSNIAQSFNKSSVIVFGATSPKYLQLSKNCTPVYDKRKHSLCNHVTRDEEIQCCEPFCMNRIGVDEVFSVISKNI